MNKILLLLLICVTSGLFASELGSTLFFMSDTSALDTAISITDSSKVFPDSTKMDKEERGIVVVYNKPYIGKDNGGGTISAGEIHGTDYRYTGDIIKKLPFGFLQELGITGQPSEVVLYGLGNGNISSNLNGIQKNNRWRNSLSQYYIQSELIDSLEIIPITSGFLYNSQNNPVQINYLTRSGITKRPYSRIRFYQATNEEGQLDILFNAPVFKKTYLHVEVTNTSIDPLGNRTDPEFNNDFSLWNVESNVRYLVSDNINLTASYNHVKDKTGLFGGVEMNSEMYDVNGADFIYQNRYRRITRNDFSLTANAEFIKNSPLNISAYYQHNMQEYWCNRDSSVSGIPSFDRDTKYKTFGISGRQILHYGIFDLDMIGNYEHTNYESGLFGSIGGDNVLSAASRLSLNLFGTLKPSFFVKTSNYKKVQYNGFGGEGVLEISNSLRFSVGVSFVEKPFSVIEDEYLVSDVNISKQKLNIAQLNAEYSTSHLKAVAGYFYCRNDNMPLPFINDYADTLVNEISGFETEAVERSGVSLSLSVRIWKLLFSNNAAYYLDINSNKYNSLPEFTLSGGLYYIDTLFNNNLYLKAGLNYSLTGEKSYVTYDFETSRAVYYTSTDGSSVSPISSDVIPFSKQLDLFAAGTIRKNATIYIVYENVLNEDYYVLPYYPVYRQGLRIGLSWEFLD